MWKVRFDLQLRPGSTVLVPLCGKSLDLAWLAEQGHPVVGVELSAVAVAAFFAERGLDPQRRRLDDQLERWSCGPFTLYCGDFFQLHESYLPAVKGIYDRAALIALPPAARTRYVNHLRALAPAPTLLITLEYEQSAMSGPPFAVPETEVQNLYHGDYHVACRHTAGVLDNNPRLRTRGLPWLTQKVFHLRPRAPGVTAP